MDKTALGFTARPVVMPIERGKIREFARAIKDDNPIYFDEEYAKREVGGIMPPPTFLITLALWEEQEARKRLKLDYKRLLHGEQEYEFFAPIYAGDTLTAVTKITNIFDKAGSRGGQMTFAVLETEFTNQRGEKVALGRMTLIETSQAGKE